MSSTLDADVLDALNRQCRQAFVGAAQTTAPNLKVLSYISSFL
jgi:hypothetical protein